MSRPRREPDQTHYSGRVAARLGELIDRRGWTIEEACQRLAMVYGSEIKPQTLRSWLRGDRDVPSNLYPAVAEVFGFASTPGWLPPR